MTDAGIQQREISAILSRARMDFQPIQLRARIRRALARLGDMRTVDQNYVGTMLPVPFDKSPLALRPIIGEVAEGIQFYASRFASNPPTVEVMPLTVTDAITDKLDKLAGKQELFDAVLLDAMGIGTEKRRNHRKMAMAQAITEAGYYVLKPRAFDFGVPTREYYTDEEASVLKAAGKRLAPVKGAAGWAEHADTWSARKGKQRQAMAVNPAGYFDLQVYPRDMVMKGRDSAGLKWAAVVESIPAGECGPGSDLASSWVTANMGKTIDGRRVTEDDRSLWGLWKDAKGRIIGGIESGGPPFAGSSRAGDWTLIQFFTRTEMVYLITGGNGLDGGQEVYRCDHGATDQGVPVVPVFECATMYTDIETMGSEFMGPMSQVFAYAPLINQLETLFSAAAAWNTAPRFYCRLPDGTVLRDDNGEPKFFDAAPVPGTDPSQIGAYPGEILPLTINTQTIEALLPIYLEQLARAMPSQSATGDAASSGTAWLAQQNIQQQQQTIEEPVANHREAVGALLRVAHDYLRHAFGEDELYFFEIPQLGGAQRSGRGLVTFKACDLTDSFVIQQELETSDERTVLLQIGEELLEKGRIDLDEYYRNYYRARDPREMQIRALQQAIYDNIMGTRPAAPGSFIDQISQGVQGRVHMQLLQESQPYALNYSRAQAQQANAQAQAATQPPTPDGAPPSQPGLGGAISEAAGVSRPGMGMAPTLAGQLGSGAPQ